MAVVIQIRGGTAAEWLAADPILADREPGVETDTRKSKYGNGIDVWSDLPYATSGGIKSFRGNYDVSSDIYPEPPAVTGTGDAGAIDAGDEWIVPDGVFGTLTDRYGDLVTVLPGTILKAAIANPGQTPANWRLI